MIRALRRRLTGLYALLSALVLAAALGTGGVLEVRALVRTNTETLLAAVRTVASRIGEGSLSDSWLAGQEQAAGCRFYLEDNGTPLAYVEQTGVRALLTDELLARCATLQAGESAVFDYTAPDGRSCRCAAMALVPANLRKAPRPLLALQDAGALHRQIRWTVAKYVALWAGGVALLTAAGALLAHIALKPTAEALRQQNEFVAAASHELRSPLTVIRSSLQAAEEDPERRERLLAIARAETSRMQRLTEELLFLAGQDAHILHLRTEPLEPDTLLLELWEAWRAPVRESGCTLTIDLPEEPLPAIQADRQRLEQLFGILLHNALDYSPTGGRVQLAAQAQGRAVRFSVQDEGPGVPDADKQRIFRRFTRGETSRTGKEHFGLGLSIARQIATLHGGRIWVEDAAGGGARFCLELPAAV